MTLLEQTIAANEKKYRKIFLDALNAKMEDLTTVERYNHNIEKEKAINHIIQHSTCSCPVCNGTMGFSASGKYLVCCSCKYKFPVSLGEIESGAKASNALKNIMGKMYAEKEAPTMQVEYNGFTGELVKLKQRKVGPCNEIAVYDISIYNSEKKVNISADGVKLSDIKFLGGAVSFGG